MKHTGPIPLHSTVLLKEKVMSCPIFLCVSRSWTCDPSAEGLLMLARSYHAHRTIFDNKMTINSPVLDFQNLVPKFTFELNAQDKISYCCTCIASISQRCINIIKLQEVRRYYQLRGKLGNRGLLEPSCAFALILHLLVVSYL